MHLPWCPVPVAPRRISVTPPALVPAPCCRPAPSICLRAFHPSLPAHLGRCRLTRVARAGGAGRGQPGALVARVGRRRLVGNLFIASQLTMPCPGGAWSAAHRIACWLLLPSVFALPFPVFTHPLTLRAQPSAVCKEMSRSPA